MKFMLAPLLICGLLQVVWVSLLTDFVTAEGCVDNNNNQTECCGAGCSFYNCSSTNETVNGTSVCSSENDTTALCPKDLTISASLCESQPTTTPAADVCTKLTTQDTCCTGNCAFYNCTDKEGVITPVCTSEEDPDKICPKNTSISSPNICMVTPAPATPTPESGCKQFKNDSSGCCGSPGCAFYNCTQGTINITFCDANTTELVCPESYVRSYNLCGPAPPTTPAASTQMPTESPTQSPSAGEQSGQRFDGASFIGGIVLCLGLVAIAFFGLKFYKSRQDANYHTL